MACRRRARPDLIPVEILRAVLASLFILETNGWNVVVQVLGVMTRTAVKRPIIYGLIRMSSFYYRVSALESRIIVVDYDVLRLGKPFRQGRLPLSRNDLPLDDLVRVNEH